MRLPVLLAFIAGIATSACGGSGTGPAGSGTLRMTLKDSPFSDAKALLVTFTDVSVHQSDTADGTWTKITTGSRTCDLKRLQNAQDVLGTTTLPQGITRRFVCWSPPLRSISPKQRPAIRAQPRLTSQGPKST